MMREGRIGGILVLICGATYLAVGAFIPEAVVGDPLGPKVFPMVLGGLMVCLGLSLCLAPDTAGAETRGGSRLGMVASLAGLLAAYGYSLPMIGYPIGTFLFLAVTARLMGERSWTLGIALSAGLSLGIYLLFTRVLDVPLPLGLLEFLKG